MSDTLCQLFSDWEDCSGCDKSGYDQGDCVQVCSNGQTYVARSLTNDNTDEPFEGFVSSPRTWEVRSMCYWLSYIGVDCDGETIAQGDAIATCANLDALKVTLENAIAALGDEKQDKLKGCGGADLAGGSQIPTCTEMGNAITAAIDAIPEPESYKKCGGDDVDGELVQCDQFDELFDAAMADEDRCMDLPVQESCGVPDKVGFFTDASGCGRLFRYSKEPLPTGYQSITKNIVGFEWTTLTTESDYGGEFVSGADAAVHEVFKGCKTFTKEDWCQLATTGQNIQIEADARIAYHIETDNAYTHNTPLFPDGTENPHNYANQLAPYQWSAELQVNGVQIAVDSDARGLAPTNQNFEGSDLLDGIYVTANEDVEVCVFIYVLRMFDGDAGVFFGDDNDRFGLDTANIGVRLTNA